MDPGSSHAAFAASGILRVNVLAHVPVEINRETQEKKSTFLMKHGSSSHLCKLFFTLEFTVSLEEVLIYTERMCITGKLLIIELWQFPGHFHDPNVVFPMISPRVSQIKVILRNLVINVFYA